jgi:hypothetical protein
MRFQLNPAGHTRILGCTMGTPSRYAFLQADRHRPFRMVLDRSLGKGYATDTCRSALDFAFGPLNLHRVTAAIGPENAASHTVVQHLGFVHEGVLRDHVFTNGAWRDSVLYSLLAPEWRHEGALCPTPAL